MRTLILCVGLFWCVATQASHSYGGLDLCALYPETMPPGMPPQELPQVGSQAAGLLETYCEQCHALPGPGRHTADEWLSVLDRMNLLMDVSNRFGGLMGKVRVPDTGEKEIIRTYLTDNALQELQGTPRGTGAAEFATHCGGCHVLPAAGQHSPERWPAVLERMQRNMAVMKYSPPSADVMGQIQLYLQQNIPPAPGPDRHSAATTGASRFDVSELLDERRWMAVGPFLLLIVIGLSRWWRGRNR
ncbi:MAG: hypothetical protein RQ736_09870 [Thiogranum sp.]|nr:hypothetical protein [Thiogranum sp.]